MNALGEWLKQIVLVVVLAALSDLLLPTKAMQKYVRVVMGLAIIALILQPVLPFFQKDWANHMATAAEQEILGGAGSTNAVSVPDASRLRQDLHAQKDEAVNKSVEVQLTDGIARQFQCDVEEVMVSGAARGPLSTQVTVTLQPLDAQKAADVRKWVANQLAIAQTQVQVKTSAGG